MKERRSKTRIRRKNMGIKRVVLLLILIFIAIQLIRLIVPATITVSRYVYAKVRSFYFATQEFYFTSDKLSNTGSYFDTTNWSGSGSYDVLVGVTTKGNLKDDDYILFHVEAISRGPYIETLTGDFKVGITNLGMSYEINDNPNDPYLQLSVTNTRNYYFTKEAFGGYGAGVKIPVEEYLSLSDENRAKCESMNVRLDFDPDVVVLDTTSGVYLDAVSNNLTTTEVGSDGKNYVNSIQFHVDAEESRIIKFYKKNIAEDYTYPAVGNTTPVVVTTDLNAGR